MLHALEVFGGFYSLKKKYSMICRRNTLTVANIEKRSVNNEGGKNYCMGGGLTIGYISFSHGN